MHTDAGALLDNSGEDKDKGKREGTTCALPPFRFCEGRWVGKHLRKASNVGTTSTSASHVHTPVCPLGLHLLATLAPPLPRIRPPGHM